MQSRMNIAGRMIGDDCPPFIVAEMSANHDGEVEAAFRIIEAARNAGADAVKIQTYRADTITLDSDRPEFRITDGLWAGQTLYQLYEKAHTPWGWHEPLFAHARRLGITLFSSPFDKTAVDLLEDLGAPAYKIASFELVDLPLITYVAGTGKPMILSTGLASAEEIQEAVEAARAGGCAELALLHCVSGYPAPALDYNLRTMQDIRRRFGLVTGLSDHTLDATIAIASVALGASIIEKHVTLDRGRGGPDDTFSLEPTELASLCRACSTAWHALGTVDYERKPSEAANALFRRSLYFVRALEAGALITEDDVRSVRPACGIPPKYFHRVIGKRTTRAIAPCTPVTFDSFIDDEPLPANDFDGSEE